MKFALIFSLMVMASSAFSAEFFAKIDNTTCSIKNGVVTKNWVGGEKGSQIGYTITKNVTLGNLDAYLNRITETSSNRHSEFKDIVFSMRHDDKNYILNVNESKEAMILIRMISSLCM